jgi:hypothetical protein
VFRRRFARPDTTLQTLVLAEQGSPVGARTLGEVVYGQRPAGVLGQKLERDLWLALADHQMHDDQALVDNGPGRVAQAVGEGAEDLGDACLAGVGGHEDVLDIL